MQILQKTLNKNTTLAKIVSEANVKLSNLESEKDSTVCIVFQLGRVDVGSLWRPCCFSGSRTALRATQRTPRWTFCINDDHQDRAIGPR